MRLIPLIENNFVNLILKNERNIGE